jgi:hypothetical protein
LILHLKVTFSARRRITATAHVYSVQLSKVDTDARQGGVLGQWTTTSGTFLNVPRRQQNVSGRRLPWKCTLLRIRTEGLNLLKRATMTMMWSDTAMP